MLKRTVLLALTLSSGCAVHQVQRGPRLDPSSRWVLLPMMNFAETPQAGERSESILATLLRIHGVAGLTQYPVATSDTDLPELDERRRYEAALAWGKSAGFTYGVTGSVQEWRYRSGLDGEPAVGLSIQVIDLATGRVVWSATGARSGWGRDSVAGTAQKLLDRLLADLQLEAPPTAPDSSIAHRP